MVFVNYIYSMQPEFRNFSFIFLSSTFWAAHHDFTTNPRPYSGAHLLERESPHTCIGFDTEISLLCTKF
ncbi:MAG: hypothetical protein ACKPKO_25270, partial [Candidatus Fonsibacter sp.]